MPPYLVCSQATFMIQCPPGLDKYGKVSKFQSQRGADMPAKTKVTDLSKYGASGANAVKAHANDAVKEGYVNLPPGISGGVARLQECYFGEYEKDSTAMGVKKGDVYFAAVGVVVEPEVFAGQKIRGLHTRVNRPYCATDKRTQDENVAEVIQEIKRLAGEGVKITEPNSLPAICAALEKAKPYFRFSTSPRKAVKEDPSTGVKIGDVVGAWENWHGIRGLESYTPPQPGSAMKDASPSANGVHTESSTPPQESVEGGYDELMELAIRAPHDKEANQKLTSLAVEAGYTDEEVTNAEEWADVVKMIRNPRNSGVSGSPDEDTEDEYEPKKGDHVWYTPEGKKKAVGCEVVNVSAKKQTADLVTKDKSKTPYKAVSWDALTKAE